MNLQERSDVLIPLVAPAAGTTSGVPVQIGNIVCIPQSTQLVGEDFIGVIKGTFKMAKKAGETWAVTDDLFYSPGDLALTKTDTGTLLRCGKPTEAVTDAAAVLAWVLFDGGVAASSVNLVDVTNMPTMAAVSAAAGNVIQSAGATKEIKDSGVLISNLPTMAAASVGEKKVVRAGGADKTLVADGPDYDLLPTMAAAAAAPGTLIQSAGADRTQSDSGIVAANVAQMPAVGGVDELLYTAAEDRSIAKSGLTKTNTPQMANDAVAPDLVLLSAAAGKTLKASIIGLSDLMLLSRLFSVEVTIALGATSGSSAADPALVTCNVFSYFPKSGNNQPVTSIVMNGDGSVTVTVAAAESAEAKFQVMVYAAV